MSESIKRNKNFAKQVKLSLVFRVLAILISFVLVRYMLEYLGTEKYGIWSVILSFMTWVLFFDLGIANGVKNKVAESLAKNNFKDAKEYISTGYVILLLFCIVIYSVLYIVFGFIDWQTVFNTTSVNSEELTKILRIVLFFILLDFILSIITAVFNATQKTSFIVFNQFLSNFFSLIMVLLLLHFSDANLLYLSISYGVVLVSTNLILSVWFYKRNMDLSPNCKYYKKEKVKDISSLGMKFFLLQLTIFFMLTTDRIIITQLLGPSIVTNYDILYKYFGAILILHNLFNGPLWSMYTEAYVKNDHKWISETLLKMTKLFSAYIAILLVLIVFADLIIEIWLDNPLLVFTLSNYIYVSIMILALAWHNVFAYFTNGIEKTKVQLYATLFGALINIPLSIVFVKYLDMGLNGVLLATIISLLIFGILGPIQALKEIKCMREK